MTQREKSNDVLNVIAPLKLPTNTISMPTPTGKANERLLVDSLDGSDRFKKEGRGIQCNKMEDATVDDRGCRVQFHRWSYRN